MSQQNNSENKYTFVPTDPSAESSSGTGAASSHHADDLSSHHHSGSSSSHHHSSGSSSHHHSGSSSSHHSSGSSSHHSSGSSKHHHSSGSSSHHSSGSSKHHHSSGSSRHRQSTAESPDYYYENPTSARDAAAEEKMRHLSKKYSENYAAVASAEAAAESLQQEIQKKKKKSKASKIIMGVLLFIFLLVVIAAVALLIMIYSGKKNLLDYDDAKIQVVDEAETEDDGKTIRYNGKIYRLNENVTSIACLGVDKEEINQNGLVGSAGQADTIMVVAFDTETGLAKLIAIPRDTVAQIDVYAKTGSFQRQEDTQICLAYAYGDGGETSCENVVASIQRVMFGMPIRSYAALDLAGISVLNDAVGGVTVTPEDTFSKFQAGQTVTLHGEDAIRFVRTRDTSKIDSNLVRMKHQMTYVNAFTRTAVSKATKDFSVVTDLYNTASKYSYTNIGLSKASYLAARFLATTNRDFFTINVPGKMVEGDDGYAEYYVDEEKFFEDFLSVYYTVIGTY